MATLNVSGVSSERFYLTANTVLTLLDGVDGQSLILIITQDSIGSHTFSIANSSGLPSISTGANTSTILQLIYDAQTGLWNLPTTSSTSGNEPANTVLAGPVSGGPALPTYRALVAADLSGLVMSVATLTLTAAQILALNGAPVQIVAAPGAGKMLVPVIATFQYKFGTLAYGNVTDAAIVIGVSGTLGTQNEPIQTGATGFIDQTASQVAMTDVDSGPMAQTAVSNAALLVANEQGSGEFTTGDGTMVVMLWYFTVALS
jgi:hypothetical protein